MWYLNLFFQISKHQWGGGVMKGLNTQIFFKNLTTKQQEAIVFN